MRQSDRIAFRGREEIYPILWESKTGRSGYSPACNNEWAPGICEKPRIKCTDCPNQAFTPVTDAALYEHLSGRRTLDLIAFRRHSALDTPPWTNA